MAHKNEEEYKTSPQKRARDEQWRLDHPGYHSEASKKNREAKKQNILYMISIDDEYYFGHTSMGMVARRADHIEKSKANKHGAGNPRMKKLFQILGEDEFKKKIVFKVIKIFPTKNEAKAAEKLMLSQYVGQPDCMNKHK